MFNEWENLALPIGLAFFFYHTAERKIRALYPSPAGATESLLPLNAWESLQAENPVLSRLAPDVEGMLVNRMKAAGNIICCRLIDATNWSG